MSGLKTKVKLKGDKRQGQQIPELESQFILRVPEEHGTDLESLVTSGDLKDKLSVDIGSDTRHADIKFNKISLSGKVMDIPCVVESWKTFDKKSFWKTGDISQMLVCKHKNEEDESSSDEETSKMQDPYKKQLLQAKKYQLPHGLTAPLKNVRRRRFRKTAKKKYIESPEVEREVKRLLRADISAVHVTFEVQSEEKPEDDHSATSDLDIGTNNIPSPVVFIDESSNFAISDIDADSMAILPDISSSEDEAPNVDNIDIDDTSLDMTIDSESQQITMDEFNLNAEMKLRLIHLNDRLQIIQNKKMEQEKRVQDSSNPFLKQRFQSDLDKMIREEETVINEITQIENS